MEPSPLVYDTAAAAAVWQRVGPALPAYDAAPCPAGACCPLPRRETDSESMLGGLIAEGAALYAACRRCAVRAPRQSRQALEQLAREEQRAVRALLAAYFLHTGRWRQPPAPAAGVRETWLAAQARGLAAESYREIVINGIEISSWGWEWKNGSCLRQLLAAEADRAAERGKRLANLLEKALTTENNLLKW